MSPEFTKSELNPLTELSELKMQLQANGEELDLICQIVFATAEVEFSSRAYRVGIRQARLQLYFEGWETVLGQNFGDKLVQPVERSSEQVEESVVDGRVAMRANLSTVTNGSLEGTAGKGVRRQDTRQSNTKEQPVTRLPNNAWNIEGVDVDASEEPALSGTIIAGERLCSLQRREGSNRSRILAEIQIRKSNFCVEPTKGNKLGKRFSILRNKDAIIAKVLENALSREAEETTNRALEATLVASKVEFEER